MNIHIYIFVYEKIAGNTRQHIIKKIGGWLIRKLSPGPSCATFPPSTKLSFTKEELRPTTSMVPDHTYENQ